MERISRLQRRIEAEAEPKTKAWWERYPERFAQTGTGWVLRELSLAEPERVVEFIAQHAGPFSTEALRSATAKLPQEERLRLIQLHRKL
jgi:hypothetical protein